MTEQALHFHAPAKAAPASTGTGRWSVAQIEELFALPFPELIARAGQVHREHFNPAQVELATLLSIKTGGCPENCSYCPQSVHYDTGVEASKLMETAEVQKAAKLAKEAGAQRFCMGAAWRSPKDRDIEKVVELIKVVKAEGLEACCTLGMLEDGHAEQLRDAGLDYYNHNIDTAPEFYGDIISTRDYQDRLNTLDRVRGAGVRVCSGGIIGMGETPLQRAELIAQLANMEPVYPDSVPINNLVKVEGTPLANAEDIDPFDFIRMIAVARITMPKARVRLSAGRQQMDDTMQALCFIAGANSIFYGEKLLTTGNPDVENDRALLKRLGMNSTGIASDYTGGLRSTEELLSADTCGHKAAHDAEHGHEHSASCSHA